MTRPHCLAAAGLLLVGFLLVANCGATASKQQATSEQDKRPSKQHTATSLVADKKQGDAPLDSLAGHEEYVQIKPEEINANEQGAKEAIEAALALDGVAQQPQVGVAAAAASSAAGAGAAAEHKSADDELSAHLAQPDAISSLESSPQPQTVAAAPRAAGYGAPPPPQSHRPARYPPPPPPPYGQPAYAAGRPNGPRPHSNSYRNPRALAPSAYMALKGKLAGGINSLVHQAGAPIAGSLYGAPMHTSGGGAYPPTPLMQGGARYLPRGAAAGYAAFREFVRAQANKYNGAGRPQIYGGGSPLPPMPPPPPPAHHHQPGGRYNQQHEERRPQFDDTYSPGDAYLPAKQAPQAKTKVTVAQAYIPHLAPASAAAQAEQAAGGAKYNPAETNPVLATLYGGHAPQGQGKPEYNKDYGMVIHYPQATVYTEPMTVDQLNKLTGPAVTQVLEQLQYNLAHGQRDESNIIRPNQKHHLGHGMTIQAKEYYAPNKGGHYVPTTAAVISTSPTKGSYDASSGDAYGHQQQSVGGNYQQAAGAGELSSDAYGSGAAANAAPPSEYSLNDSLGSGYERVKATAAQSAAASGKQYSGADHPSAAAQHAPAADYPRPPTQTGAYAGRPQKQPYSTESPSLSAITSLLGSELESLSKASAALNKHLGPEVHAQIQSYANKSPILSRPLRVTEHDQRAPLTLHAANSGRYGPPPAQQQRHHMHHRPTAGYGPAPAPRGRGGQRHRPAPGYGPRGHAHQQQYRPQSRPHQHRQQQQNGYAQNGGQSQALEHQMMQLLHDFRVGDEQYNSKGVPNVVSQGYPHKVMQQKYNQQQQQQQQQQQYAAANSNNYGAGHANEHGILEIPESPNDQIGEISELLDALKGTLESHVGKQPDEQVYGNNGQHQQNYQQQQSHQSSNSNKIDSNKIEDVRYLATALGQVPSFGVQVPVAHHNSAEAAVHEAARKAASGAGQAQTEYQQPQHAAPAPAAQPAPAAADYQPQQPAAGGFGAYAVGQSQQQQQQQAPSYGQQQQQAQDYQQQQQLVQGAEYGLQPANGYAGQELASQAIAEHHQPQRQQATAYTQPQQQPQQQQQQQQGPAASYSVSEHNQVINHLVPVASQQSLPQADQLPQQQQQQHHSSEQLINSYSAHAASAASPSSAEHQPLLTSVAATAQHEPINQISVAAPSDGQYHSGQSLSSFVDSLPSDYQELLRHPATPLLDGAASDQEAVYSSNVTSGSGSPAHSAASPSSNAASSQEASKASSSSSRSSASSSAASSSASSASSAASHSPTSQSSTYHQKSSSAASSPSSSASSSAGSTSSAASQSSSSSQAQRRS